MAISPMQKVEIFGHRSEKGEVLRMLQDLGIMEVSDFGDTDQDTPVETVISETSQKISELKEQYSGVQFSIRFLQPYLPKQNFLEKMANKRLMVSREEYVQISESFDYQQVVAQCNTFDVEKVELLNQLDKLKKERDAVLSWLPMEIPVDQIADTKTTIVRTFTIRKNLCEKLISSLESFKDAYDLIRIQQVEIEDAVLLIYLKEERDAIEAVLQEIEHHDVSWEGYQGTPKQIVASIEREMDEMEQKLKWIAKETVKMVAHRPKLLLMEDYLSNAIERLEIEKQFAQTKNAFVIQGWTRTEDFDQLQEQIEKQFSMARVIRAEQAKGEKPPVLLKNKNFSEPFEVVTNLYGSPSYYEIDPTPALAPFFILLLAICITDGGYGLVMALFGFVAMKFLRLGQGMRKLFKIIFYTGIVTVVVGIFTGGYFGIDFSGLSPSLQALRNRFLFVDPMNQPVLFLLVSFAIGFVHISFGVLVEFYDKFRKGKWVDGLFDQISWIFFLWGIALYAVSSFGLLPSIVGVICKWMALVSGLVIFLFSGRENKSIIGRLGSGLFELYGITGYFGDILSYSRVMAMGMATGVIAMVVNIFVGMVKGIPVVGIVVAALLFVFGHIFNILINLVSGFVHTMRLQFVEFFGKFLEGDGKPFKPFQTSYRYVLFSSGDIERK
ncbi:V-type ATP synthase subunit I [bacterium]|nr:V-type ATP synthase subunit I [bacterium]